MPAERNVLISVSAHDGMLWTRELRLSPEDWHVVGVDALPQALRGRRPALVCLTPGAAHRIFEERRDWHETVSLIRERCPVILALKEV